MWHVTGVLRDRIWPSTGWDGPSFRSRLYESICGTRPDVVGFSLWDFYDHPEIAGVICDVIARLREDLGVPIIIGGPGMSTVRSRRDAFELFKPDYIIHHEGDDALPRLLGALDEGASPSGLPNLSYKDNRFIDGAAKPVKDLDSLSYPDFSDYDLDSFFLPVRVLPALTSRGCEWSRCAFCNHHATYPGYSEMSPSSVIDLIRHCKESYTTNLFMFHDESLSARRARLLTDALASSGIKDVYFYSYAYPRGYDAALLRDMHRAGFRTLVWGVESGSQRVLDSMLKGTSVSEVEGILKASSESGITNVLFILFGFPGETREDALQTVEFLKRNSEYVERHSNSIFFLQEGSPIADDAARWGLIPSPDGDPSAYKVSSGLQNDEIRSFLRDLDSSGVRTASGSMYHMPGDTEFRAYLFMQSVFGETSVFGSDELYPVVNGTLKGSLLSPSFFSHDASRPELQLDTASSKLVSLCDGTRPVAEIKKILGDTAEGRIRGLMVHPYLIFYKRSF